MSQHSHGPSGIWVTRFIDRARGHTIDNPLVLGCLTLGLVPVALTLLFFGLTADQVSPTFVIAHLLAMAVPFVGPSAIWYWDSRVFPRFVEETAELAVDPAAVHQLAGTYTRIFRTRFLYFAVPWTTLVVGLIGLNIGYFRTLGVDGVGDPAFVIYLLFAVWWGLITGIGFHGALTAVRAIHALGDLELAIDPLHPDGFGGLSSVGYFAIWTTMLISLGSLTLPLAFILATEGGYSALVYLAVGVYVVVIAVSFIYPTVYINRRAQEIREAELEERRTKIRRLQAQAEELESADAMTDATGAMEEVATRLEIKRLRDEFTEYDQVNLYPFSVGILVRLVSSVLLPIAFTIFEMFLGRLL